MTSDEPVALLVAEIANHLIRLNHTVTTVESCTGGGIAHNLTDIAGSSAWFERSFVTYSNQAKSEMVDVPVALLEQYGAVSIEVAESMALGGKYRADADYCLSVTGIAGPDGGSSDKPVGTVCFGWACPDKKVNTQRMVFDGDRSSVRLQSVIHSLSELLKILGKNH